MQSDNAIALELEEQSISRQRLESPDHPGLIRDHVAVLTKMGKSVPPELEERSLQNILHDDPNNANAIKALVSLYLRIGKPISPELEKRSLVVALAERPGDPELLRAMAAVEYKLASPSEPQSATATHSGPATAPPMAPVAPAAAANRPSSMAALESALRAALLHRPMDSFLQCELIRCLVAQGRISPGMDPFTVMAELPTTVQTNEVMLKALLAIAAKSP